MTFATREAGGLPYRLHIPAGSGPFTAILFLHGAGESGSDNEAQIRVGLPPRVVPGSPWNEFVVIAPQKPSAANLWPAHAEALDAILREVEAELGDRLGGRRVLTGLSQGGHGTLNLARSLRWSFSALGAVCGWMDPARVPGPEHTREERWRAPAGEWTDPDLVRERLSGLPLWLFHGTEDASVSVARTQEIADLLPEALVSIYPGVGHDSWDSAYDEPTLPEWFATQ